MGLSLLNKGKKKVVKEVIVNGDWTDTNFSRFHKAFGVVAAQI